MNPTPENDTPLTDAKISAIYESMPGDCEYAELGRYVWPERFEELKRFARELERDREMLREMLEGARVAFNANGHRATAFSIRAIIDQSRALDAKLSKETK